MDDSDVIKSINKKLRLATKYLDDARQELKQLSGAEKPPARTARSDGPDTAGFGVGNKSDEWFDVDNSECKAETQKALCVVLPDGREEWFPKSQVSPESEVLSDGDRGTLSVSEWIAKEKELV